MATTAHMVEEKNFIVIPTAKKFYQQVDCIRRRIRRLIANHSLVTFFFLSYYKQTPLGINIIRNCPF